MADWTFLDGKKIVDIKRKTKPKALHKIFVKDNKIIHIFKDGTKEILYNHDYISNYEKEDF